MKLATFISKLAHLRKEDTHFARERFAKIVQVPVHTLPIPPTDHDCRIDVSMLPYEKLRRKTKERKRRIGEKREGNPIRLGDNAHFGGAPLYGLGLLLEDMVNCDGKMAMKTLVG